jgi:hypothetical protein
MFILQFSTYQIYVTILIVCLRRINAKVTILFRKSFGTHTNFELHFIYYMLFDVLFLHDTDYVCYYCTGSIWTGGEHRDDSCINITNFPLY